MAHEPNFRLCLFLFAIHILKKQCTFCKEQYTLPFISHSSYNKVETSWMWLFRALCTELNKWQRDRRKTKLNKRRTFSTKRFWDKDHYSPRILMNWFHHWPLENVKFYIYMEMEDIRMLVSNSLSHWDGCVIECGILFLFLSPLFLLLLSSHLSIHLFIHLSIHTILLFPPLVLSDPIISSED